MKEILAHPGFKVVLACSVSYFIYIYAYAHEQTLHSIYSHFSNITLTFQNWDTKHQVLKRFPRSDASAVSGITPAI